MLEEFRARHADICLVAAQVSQGMVYVCPERHLDGPTIDAFVQAYRAGTATGTYFGTT